MMHRILVVYAILAAMVGQGIAAEDDPGQALLAMVKDRDQAIQNIVRSETKGETPEERAQLKAIVGELFDFEALSKLSLGRYWADRTDAERREFIDLNRKLIEKNYADPKLYTKAEKIEYEGVTVEGDDGRVKTVVHYKDEMSTIEYVLHRVDKKWLIYDMIIDDLSIGKSNRSQFRKQIRKTSFEGLMDKLRSKLVESDSGEKGGT